MTNGNEVCLKYDYCGLCPYFNEIILSNTLKLSDYDIENSLLLCMDFHGIGMFPRIARRLTKEEYETIPDWCTQLPYKGDMKGGD
jgi:hypothetical protein